jgi:hypothetical protein
MSSIRHTISGHTSVFSTWLCRTVIDLRRVGREAITEYLAPFEQLHEDHRI